MVVLILNSYDSKLYNLWLPTRYKIVYTTGSNETRHEKTVKTRPLLWYIG
jgi:hypothetical protein